MEYSKEYSKAVAFDESTYPAEAGSGSKPIKIGETTYWYDPSVENEHSALPKKDIEELITQAFEGLSGDLALMTNITIINGVIKKKTRTLTFNDGVLKSVSPESAWS